MGTGKRCIFIMGNCCVVAVSVVAVSVVAVRIVEAVEKFITLIPLEALEGIRALMIVRDMSVQRELR